MRVRRSIAAGGLALATLGALLGCGGTEKKLSTGILQYSENAKRAYDQAMLAYRDRDWQEATAQFRDVRRRFSFSVYAPLAQLRLADIEYEQEKWIESIAAYKTFNRENPKHPDAAWARMRIARSYYNQISDAFLLPPQEQRDQSPVIEAQREIGQYLQEFPQGPEHEEMKKLYSDALARLVQHELYVARFYMTKEKLDAALARAAYAVQKYKGSVRDAEALIVQGELYLMLKKRQEARASFETVVQKYASDPRVVEAKKYLAEMDAAGE